MFSKSSRLLPNNVCRTRGMMKDMLDMEGTVEVMRQEGREEGDVDRPRDWSRLGSGQSIREALLHLKLLMPT